VDEQTVLVLHEEKFFEGQEFAAAGGHLYLDDLTPTFAVSRAGTGPELGAGPPELVSRYAAAG
jgi:hypothetical protein